MGEEIEKYADIIGLEHPTSKRHPRMKPSDRAAQFSPFAALTGYDAAVLEAARVTDKKIELSEEAKTVLNEKMHMILESEPSEVVITYFMPDKKKSGGSYEKACGFVLSIDEYERVVKMSNGRIIPIDDITEIDGNIFG